jgi:hypothetical protein
MLILNMTHLKLNRFLQQNANYSLHIWDSRFSLRLNLIKYLTFLDFNFFVALSIINITIFWDTTRCNVINLLLPSSGFLNIDSEPFSPKRWHTSAIICEVTFQLPADAHAMPSLIRVEISVRISAVTPAVLTETFMVLLSSSRQISA